eukprot:Opistho-2@26095
MIPRRGASAPSVAASVNPFHNSPTRQARARPSFVPTLADADFECDGGDSDKENIPPGEFQCVESEKKKSDLHKAPASTRTANNAGILVPRKRSFSEALSGFEPVTPKSTRLRLDAPRRAAAVAPARRPSDVMQDDDGLSSFLRAASTAGAAVDGHADADTDSTTLEARMKALAGLRLPTPARARKPSVATAALAPVAHQDEWDLPVDLTMHTTARFLSKSTFAWCASASPADESMALRQSVGGDCGNAPLSNNAALRKALHYYAHPAAPWPACLVKLAGKLSSIPDRDRTPEERADAEYLQTRKDEWVQALRSAYFSVRNGDCPYFHLRSSSFSAVFVSAGVAGSADITARVSRSTRGLRMRLAKEDIAFTMPHGTDSAHTHGGAASLDDSGFGEDDSEGDEEAAIANDMDSLERMNISTRVVSGVETDGGPESMLLFGGSVAVHGLFEFVLNMRHVSGKSLGPQLVPPTIYAPVAFANSSVKMAQIKFNGSVKRSDSELGPAIAHAYTLEVAGPLLPSSVSAMCHLFAQTQSGSFEAVLKTDAMDVSANAPGVAGTEVGRLGCQ